MRRAYALAVSMAAALAAVSGWSPGGRAGVAAAVDASAAPTPPPQAIVTDAAFTDSLVTGGATCRWPSPRCPTARAVVLQKTGAVRVIETAVLPAPALTLTVCTESERGLLGVALDPDFNANGFVYLYYTRPERRCARWLRQPGQPIHDDGQRHRPGQRGRCCSTTSARTAGNHNGGDLEIGNDGYLYVSVGDAGCDPRGDSGAPAATTRRRTSACSTARSCASTARPGRRRRATRSAAPAPRAARSAATRPPRRPTTLSGDLRLRAAQPVAVRLRPQHRRDAVLHQRRRPEHPRGGRPRRLGANYGWPCREGQCADGQNPPCPPPHPAWLTQPITDYPHDRLRRRVHHRRCVRAERRLGRVPTTAATCSPTAAPASIWLPQRRRHHRTTPRRSPPASAASPTSPSCMEARGVVAVLRRSPAPARCARSRQPRRAAAAGLAGLRAVPPAPGASTAATRVPTPGRSARHEPAGQPRARRGAPSRRARQHHLRCAAAPRLVIAWHPRTRPPVSSNVNVTAGADRGQLRRGAHRRRRQRARVHAPSPPT